MRRLDQTDTTRITTLKLNDDHSSLRFPNLGVVEGVVSVAPQAEQRRVTILIEALAMAQSDVVTSRDEAGRPAKPATMTPAGLRTLETFTTGAAKSSEEDFVI
jgi:hypothetical protein